MSPTMMEGTIVKWYKEGEVITDWDVLWDIQTAKDSKASESDMTI